MRVHSGTVRGDHARAAASYLTGIHPKKTAGADIQNGISVDQVAAQALQDTTPYASLELTCEPGRLAGGGCGTLKSGRHVRCTSSANVRQLVC